MKHTKRRLNDSLEPPLATHAAALGVVLVEDVAVARHEGLPKRRHMPAPGGARLGLLVDRRGAQQLRPAGLYHGGHQHIIMRRL